MRILDDSSGRALKSVTIYLTPAEAVALAGYCEQLAEDPVKWHHSHLDEYAAERREDAFREITIAVYVDENLDQFDARSRRLIETGE